MTIEKDYKHGIPKISGVGAIVLAATAINAYLLSPGRTCKVRKIHIFNNNPANTIVTLGTGFPPAPFVAAFPGWFVVAGMELHIEAEDIPDVEFSANITAEATVAAAAPNDVDIQLEVEEYQGPTG